MKYSVLLLLSLILFSCCENVHKRNIQYFENVSNIPFPEDLNVLETFDNGEFMSCGVFTLTKDQLNYFKHKASFKRIRKPSLLDSYIYHQFPNHLLKDSANHFFPNASIVKWYHCNNCPDITMYIDTIDLKMWCYTSYPDQSGNFCCKDTLQNFQP